MNWNSYRKEVGNSILPEEYERLKLKILTVMIYKREEIRNI